MCLHYYKQISGIIKFMACSKIATSCSAYLLGQKFKNVKYKDKLYDQAR